MYVICYDIHYTVSLTISFGNVGLEQTCMKEKPQLNYNTANLRCLFIVGNVNMHVLYLSTVGGV